MPLPANSVGKGIMFLGCLVGKFVRPFVQVGNVAMISHERLELF